MILHHLQPKLGVAIVTPEDEDDLWSLRRIISKEDLLSSETTRVVKEEGAFSRPEKGERVDVFVTVRVEKVKLDSSLSRLKVSGVIVESSNEAVGRGSHHSITIVPGKKLVLKKKGWKEFHLKLLKGFSKGEGFIIVAIDRREAGVGRIKGTHLELYPSIRSGLTGKLYPERAGLEAKFYSEVFELLRFVYIEGYRIFVAGPGSTKLNFARLLKEKGMGERVAVIEGVDLAGEDGVYAVIKSDQLKDFLKMSKLNRVASILEEAIRRIAVNDERVALGFKEVDRASKLGAVESLIVAEAVFGQGVEEEALIELIDRVEQMGGSTYLVDSSTELGRQASILGGLVALLRFKPFHPGSL
ncbi:MAG: mRNA surveillance protein pelota [Nitrososphaerota archaeon]